MGNDRPVAICTKKPLFLRAFVQKVETHSLMYTLNENQGTEMRDANTVQAASAVQGKEVGPPPPQKIN